MKGYFLLFLLIVYVTAYYVSCDNLLSKFHQSDYKLKDLRIQLINFDQEDFNDFQIKAFKFNRSTTAHNITWSFKKDVKDQVEILVQVYKFLSNEYRHFPIRFQVNLEKAFEANIVGLVDATRCGNFTKCIFYKDITYQICNFALDESRFPPLIPDGRYRIEVFGLYLNRRIAALDIFGEVYRPIYPKD